MENKLTINGHTLLSQDEVAKIFDISRVTLWKWVKNGVVHQHSLGKAIFFIEEELFEDIKKSGNLIRKSHKQKISSQG